MSTADFELSRSWWAAAAKTFGLLNLRPAVMPCRQTEDMPIGQGSKLKKASFGKVPSVVRQIAGEGVIYGMPGWAERRTDAGLQKDSVIRWASMPGVGISVVTDGIAAVDVDIDDPLLAADVRDFVVDWLSIFSDAAVAVRWRENSAHLLIPVRLAESYDLDKVVLHQPSDDSGIVEFLAGRRQFIAAGINKGSTLQWSAHTPGSPSEPLAGLPLYSHLPELDADAWAALQRDVEQQFGGERKVRRVQSIDVGALRLDDPTWQWLRAHEATIETTRGQAPMLLLRCPFGTEGELSDDQHEADPEGSTTTVVLPPTADIPPVIDCKHATCTGRPQREFLDRLGWQQAPEKAAADAYYAERASERVQSLMRPVEGDKQKAQAPQPEMPATGAPPPGLLNKKSTLSDVDIADILSYADAVRVLLRKDEHSGETYIREWSPAARAPAPGSRWRRLQPDDVSMLQIRVQNLVRRNNAVGQRLVERGAELCAFQHRRNFMVEQLEAMRVDGFEGAIARLANEVMEGEGPPEDRTAVMRYLFTAIVARTRKPGARADMAPVLYGSQNVGKTTLLHRLSPKPDAYVSLTPSGDDADMGRRLRGKSVVELEEFSVGNLSSEDLKRMISKTTDEYIDKFQRHQTIQKRTAVMVVTTNRPRFLTDPTGARRFPVVHVHDIHLDAIDGALLRQCWSEAMAYVDAHGEADWQPAAAVAAKNQTYDKNANYFARLAHYVDTSERDEDGGVTVDLEGLANSVGANSAEGRRNDVTSVVEGWTTRQGGTIAMSRAGRQVVRFAPNRLPKPPEETTAEEPDTHRQKVTNIMDKRK